VSFLNEGLWNHAGPVAVAIVLNKVDCLFDDEDAARAALSDEVLLEALKPLVRAVQMSEKVVHAAILPTSMFGFGRAVACQRNESTGGFDVEDIDGEAEPVDSAPWPQTARGHEAAYVAAEGASIEPYNLKPLAVWSLLAGAAGYKDLAGPSALKELAGLKQLTTLDLSGTQVTDAGLKELSGMTHLRRLWLWGTKVTDAGLKGVRQTLPACKVTR
jgi:hypothetical protein